MGLRIGKSIRLGKNIRLNVSKSGLGVSAGVKGARIGINTKGQIRKSIGANGVYYTETTTLGKNKNKVKSNYNYNKSNINVNNNYINNVGSSKNTAISLLLGIICLVVGFVFIPLLLVAIPLLIYAMVNKQQRLKFTLQRAVISFNSGNVVKARRLLDKAKRYNIEDNYIGILEDLLRDAE